MIQKPKDIAKLEEKISKLQTKEQKARGVKPQTEYGTAASIGFRIATELLSGVSIGGGIGWFLDNIFSTKPYLLIIFLLFGGAAGFLNVYRFTKQLERKHTKE